MSPPKPPTLGATLVHLRWDFLAAAVLAVRDRNHSESRISGFAADAEEWATNSVKRRELLDRVREAWCPLAKKDFTYFPYSEDYVARLYLRVARRTPEGRKTWEAEIRAKQQ